MTCRPRVLDFARGFADECALVGASVVGGDLTQANEVVIAVTVIGACTQAPVLRSGAEPGQALAIAGRQGGRSAGSPCWAAASGPRACRWRRPNPPEPPYAAGPAAAVAGATAMIDVSDGLVADAGHLAADSGVAIDLRSGAFEVPEPLHAVAAATGSDPLALILGGGEDHSLLATFDAGTVPAGWTEVGSVGEGEGVTVDGAEYDDPTGWTHFERRAGRDPREDRDQAPG